MSAQQRYYEILLTWLPRMPDGALFALASSLVWILGEPAQDPALVTTREAYFAELERRDLMEPWEAFHLRMHSAEAALLGPEPIQQMIKRFN